VLLPLPWGLLMLKLMPMFSTDNTSGLELELMDMGSPPLAMAAGHMVII